MLKAKSVTGIMSQFQKTVDQLDKLAVSKAAESQELSQAVLKVDSLGERIQLWVYNAHRKINNLIDDFQNELADKLHFKSLDAEAESQAASLLADKFRDQFNLK